MLTRNTSKSHNWATYTALTHTQLSGQVYITKPPPARRRYCHRKFHTSFVPLQELVQPAIVPRVSLCNRSPLANNRLCRIISNPIPLGMERKPPNRITPAFINKQTTNLQKLCTVLSTNAYNYVTYLLQAQTIMCARYINC